MERALTKHAYSRKKKCTDHLGNEYESLEDMFNHYGVARNTFYNRIKHGYSLERALEKPTKSTKNKIKTSRNNKNSWTDEEISIIKKYYPTEGKAVIKRLPCRSTSSIYSRAEILKLKRNR